MYRSSFFIHSASLCLLVGAFNPLTFKVIIDMYIPITILLIVLGLLIFFNLFIYLFIFGSVGSSFLCEGFLQLRRAGATLHRGARASHCRGLYHCGAQAPDVQAQ